MTYEELKKAYEEGKRKVFRVFPSGVKNGIIESNKKLCDKYNESVKVCESFLEFRFKSGMTISIEK